MARSEFAANNPSSSLGQSSTIRQTCQLHLNSPRHNTMLCTRTSIQLNVFRLAERYEYLVMCDCETRNMHNQIFTEAVANLLDSKQITRTGKPNGIIIRAH